MAVLLLIAALVLLIAGAEALVRGASRLAARLGISALVIGLTVVAFGTSAPEFAVSIKAARAGQSGLALGNVVGSNIFNVLFILGLSALITPLVASRQLVRLDVPVMIILSLVVVPLAWDGSIGRAEGMLLFAGLMLYVWFLVRQGRRERPDHGGTGASGPDEGGGAASGWTVNLMLIIGGLALLVLGARWLVESAVSIARSLSVSEAVIGLTIVAAGTSLPEVVTSVVASIRGERDIAVGNVVGSNIFNIMGVLGLAGIAAPEGIEVPSAVLRFDLPVMIAVAFACLPIFFTGGRISRWEGALLLGYYVAYTLYLVLAASHHDALPRFSAVMLFFIIPLTMVTLTIIALQESRSRSAAGRSS